jgi:hypothetical protein
MIYNRFQSVPERQQSAEIPLPVKYLPKTRSLESIGSFGVVVLVIVNFEASRPGSWEAAAVEALKALRHARLVAVSCEERTRGIASPVSTCRRANWWSDFMTVVVLGIIQRASQGRRVERVSIESLEQV